MQMLKQNIEDLKVIQSGYPSNSRGYQSLKMAITILTQLYEGNKPSMHWVAGEPASSDFITLES